MNKLNRYEFSCPFCNRDRVTFITMDKYNLLREHNLALREIFPLEAFNATYREIFISSICSECQSTTFKSPESFDNPYDVDANSNTTELEAKISDMYENAKC